MKKILLLATLVCALLLPNLTACRSQAGYRNAAVESAREFLLAADTTLTFEEREYIQFNEPVFLRAPILKKNDPGTERYNPILSSSLDQVCVAWKLPEREETFMVYGTAGISMASWSPERVIIKNFDKGNPALSNAIDKSRNFVRNTQASQLTKSEFNRFRFSWPEIYSTSFPDDFLSAQFVPAESSFKDENAIQLSMVWPMDNPDYCLVVTGYAANISLDQWQVNAGGVISITELQKWRPLEEAISEEQTPEESQTEGELSL